MLNEFSKKEAPIQGLAGMGGGVPSRLLTLASGEITYVDDVFQTFLYKGNSTARSINNGIDLDGEGGLVWTKSRTSARNNCFLDTERGVHNVLFSNLTSGTDTDNTTITSFNNNGYTMGTSAYKLNVNNEDMCSWTFRKCPGFFDVVTFTSNNSSSGVSVSHSLGSTPGMIIVKSYSDASTDWWVWHNSAPVDSSSPPSGVPAGSRKIGKLNSLERFDNSPNIINSVTSTSFNYGNNGAGYNDDTNTTFVAYIFAHNDGSFGEDSDEAVIKCGGYTGNGTNGHEINVGFEPQYVLIKNSGENGNWSIMDVMRGAPATTGSTDGFWLSPNRSDTESTLNNYAVWPTPTGFKIWNTGGSFNGNNETYVYMAIRRPHKPPEVGTEVFYPELLTSASQTSTPGFAPDMAWQIWDRAYPSFYIGNRLTGNKRYLQTYTANAEGQYTSWEFDAPTGKFTQSLSSGSTSGGIQYFFKRAPKFFDTVVYTGNGVTGRSVSHNLEVAPELLLVKCRSDGDSWAVYASSQGSSKETYLNGTGAFSTGNSIWTGTDPTATAFYVKNDGQVNTSGRTYTGLLFASLDEISKVGTYTGTGSAVNVDCGFTAGARLVIVKRTDDTGNWWCWDSARGIVSGNDPWVYLNTTTAEASNADHIDPLDAGLTVNAGTAELNASGGKYLFFAIA